MLNVYYYYEQSSYAHLKSISQVDILFKLLCKTEWFADPLVQQMVQDVDKTEVIMNELLKSKVFNRYIAPTELSTGVKGLILMLKANELTVDRYYFLSDRFGKNCFKWVFEISKVRDVNLVITSWFFPPASMHELDGYDVRFVNRGLKFHVLWKVWSEILSHAQEGIEPELKENSSEYYIDEEDYYIDNANGEVK